MDPRDPGGLGEMSGGRGVPASGERRGGEAADAGTLGQDPGNHRYVYHRQLTALGQNHREIIGI